MPLKGKEVVVTGGNGGIGQPLCRRLKEKGAVVTVVARTPELSAGIETISGDLSTFEGVMAVADALKARHVDILVNLAGIQYFGLCEQETPEHTAQLYAVNLVAPVLLTQAVLPGMKQRQSSRIVNIGSIFGSINFAHFAAYSSSKAGLRGFSEALRREVQGDGVDVLYVAPRAVRTPMNTKKILEFGRITGMNMDDPEWVAAQIVKAIAEGKKEVFLGFPEKLFVRINAVAPRIVDGALAANDRKAKLLFNSSATE